MIVRALMLEESRLVTASPYENLKIALKKIEDNNFLSIPVVEGRTFLGIISKQKIYEEYFKGDYPDKESYIENATVRGIYRNIIPKVDPNDLVENASKVLETFGIPFVAVVNNRGEFEGIVTHHAIFHAFSELFGLNEGHRIAVIAYDVPGQLAKLTDIITKLGGDIISFTVVDPEVKLDVKEIVIRLRIINIDKLTQVLRESGFKIQ